MLAVVNFNRARRLRQGLKPTLALIGMNSNADVVLPMALAAADPEDREELFNRLVGGTYRDMLSELLAFFEIEDFNSTRAIG